jgi:hypothetical protein
MREAPVAGSTIRCCCTWLLRPFPRAVLGPGVVDGLPERGVALLDGSVEPLIASQVIDCIWRG